MAHRYEKRPGASLHISVVLMPRHSVRSHNESTDYRPSVHWLTVEQQPLCLMNSYPGTLTAELWWFDYAVHRGEM